MEGLSAKISRDKVFALVLGRVVQQLRERRGLKQGDVANLTGISRSVVSRIEAGKQPTVAQFQLLARSLGTDITSLSARVDDVLLRTKRAAEAATQQPAATAEDAWNRAVAVAGVPGLAGLVSFAVSAALAGEEQISTAGEHAVPPA